MNQRFDEQQVGEILQRAAELQSGLTPDGETRGVTLAELQRVASEIGIESSVLEQAARDVQAKGATAKSAEFAHARTFDQTLPGVLSDEKWEDLVTRLRQFIGRPGKSTIQDATREWSAGWEVGNVTFTATSRNGKTRFRLLFDTSGGSALAGVVGLGIALMLTPLTGAITFKASHNAPLGFLVAFLVLMTAELTTFFTLRRWRKKTERKAAELFAALVSETD